MNITAPFPNTGSSVGGWTCQQCGAFVANNYTHSCPTSYKWMNPPPPQAPELERIAAALERIAAHLEGQAKP